MARSLVRRTTPAGSSTFCYWVKRWRSYRGVTQKEFAVLWGVSSSLVQKIEADDYSVSQLSFERLEALRALLELPSATFYPLLATQPDTPGENSENTVKRAERDLIQVTRLEAGLAPLELPRTLLGDLTGARLRTFAVQPTDFATDRLRYSLRAGTLVVLDQAQPPKNGDIYAAETQYAGHPCRALLPCGPAEPAFLRRFDSESEAVLEPFADDLMFLGVVSAYWVAFSGTPGQVSQTYL